MSKLILTGGTHGRELALFSVDALPSVRPDRAAIDALAEQGFLLRLPAGADRACSLHAYLDEPVPDDLMRFCRSGGVRHGRLRLPHGRLGFGGLESLYADFEPNEAIRSDGVLPAGDYEATAYETKFPDALVTNAIRASFGPEAKKHLAVPVKLALMAVMIAAVMIFLKAWLAALVVALAAGGALWLFSQNPTTQRLRAQVRSIERDYPSIVVALRSAAR
jgi:hypothetical protein